jgi:hypothetical protein
MGSRLLVAGFFCEVFGAGQPIKEKPAIVLAWMNDYHSRPPWDFPRYRSTCFGHRSFVHSRFFSLAIQ